MNNKETNDLTEERQIEICICEDPKCNYYPLKHFEECPKCKSMAYHLKVMVKEEVKDEIKEEIKEETKEEIKEEIKEENENKNTQDIKNN